MALEIRPIVDDEFVALHTVLNAAFGEELAQDQLDDERSWFECDRSVGVLEEGRFIGSAGAYSFDVTVPGGDTLPTAGVTWVGVLPTHRRQGILRQMMTYQLDDVVARGEPLAVLTASEGSIYGRFGYGLATMSQRAEIDTRRSELAVPPALPPGGRLRLVDKDEASKVLPPLFDAYRRATPGAVSRSDRYWDMYFRDRENWREGASTRFYVVHESADGVADGMCAYRVKNTYETRGRNTSVVLDMAATDPEVAATLWRYVFDLDLTWFCKAWNRPVEDPIKWRLVDPRAYKVLDVFDWLWVRLLDIPACLAARRYSVEGSLVVDVTDPFRPANDGRYRIDGGPAGATCTRTSDEPDLGLDVRELGAAYLGGVRLATLAAGGRVHEHRDGALRLADAMFLSASPPHCTTGF